MTWRALFGSIAGQLSKAGCEDPAFDARAFWRTSAACRAAVWRRISAGKCPKPPPSRCAARPMSARAGRPLQYILGSWDFLDMTLSVGEGVLIPRPDTELLCETAAVWLKRLPAEDHRVLDLCAGTGLRRPWHRRLVPGCCGHCGRTVAGSVCLS